jgi:hypothetical protein
MPSRAAHIAAAKQNEQTITYLLAGGDNHLAWAAAVVFYEALHIVEAILEADPDCKSSHTDDHSGRNRLLKTTNRYSHIWQMYRPLYDASLIARYLRENENRPTYEVFSRYMDKQAVQQMLIGHYLTQIKKSAAKYLGEGFMNDPEPSPAPQPQ